MTKAMSKAQEKYRNEHPIITFQLSNREHLTKLDNLRGDKSISQFCREIIEACLIGDKFLTNVSTKSKNHEKYIDFKY